VCGPFLGLEFIGAQTRGFAVFGNERWQVVDRGEKSQKVQTGIRQQG